MLFLVFGAVPVRKKDKILRAGLIVFPGLPLTLLFFARALCLLVELTDSDNSAADIMVLVVCTCTCTAASVVHNA